MECKNCGSPVSGKYCSNCGQKRATDTFTFRTIIKQAIHTFTDIEKGFLYNLKYLSIDFKGLIIDYLDGKRIPVYNPISYAIIGVSIMLLVGQQFRNALPFQPTNTISQDALYSYGFVYGQFVGNNLKYIWLLGIATFAIPASWFYKQRSLVEHMVIQSFIIGHSALFTSLLFGLFPMALPFNPILLLSMIALNIWVYWKMDRELLSPVFTPFIFIIGLVLLIILPFPIHYVVNKISIRPLERTVITEDLKHPWSIAFLNEEEAIVSEKDGVLKRVNLQTGMHSPIKGMPQDLADSIRVLDQRDNAGLFEVLLDPDYVNNPWVYLSYAAQVEGGTTTKVIRAKLLQDSLAQQEVILEVDAARPDRFHYGGGMVFGKDNKLYVAVGERFYNEIDQPDLPVSQDEKDPRGMIYRLNRDGSIPADNPNFGPESVPGVYAIGIRATQGMCLHPKTGEIWFTDHGSRKGDEINILKAGLNYGWPIRTTGSYRNEDYEAPEMPDRDFEDPFWFWIKTTAPTGLTFYTGGKIKKMENHLLVAGLSQGSLWDISIIRGKVVQVTNLLKDDPIRLRKVVQGPDGYPYLLTDEANGRIIRLSE